MKNEPRKRVLPSWQPVAWSREFESWTAAQIRTNIWRFDRTEEFDDVMQEAKILFFTLGQKYPLVSEVGHFFALYKTSLSRKFIDKARLKQRSPVDQEAAVDEEALDMRLEGNSPNLGYLSMLLEEMPEELKLVLRHLTTSRVRLKLDRPAKSARCRENHNMRLKRRFALSTPDPVGTLRTYFINS